MIQLNSIVKEYKNLRALDGVDLEIKPGITGLLGPNGAGKSTLIKLILGLVRVTSGSGTILGHTLGKQGRQIRSRVGYMPEDDSYIPGMSGVEVVQFSACLAGLPNIEALRRAHEILDFCGMKQERYRAIDTFSTGMRQKIKFAAAIAHDPELLILDEPTSGLDPEERDALLSRIKLLSEQNGKSVLISTHILPDVQAICNDIVILATGKVRLHRPLTDLSQTSSPSITVGVHGSENDFVLAMQNQGFLSVPAEGGGWRFESERDDLLKTIWDCLAQTKTQVAFLNQGKNSLEQLFMEVVRERHDASS